MSIARPAPLTLLAIALTLMAVAAALFILYAHPAYAEEGSAPDKPRGLSATATHGQVVLTWNDPEDDSITGYVILRRDRDTDAKGHFDELVADTDTAATTYTDDSVAAETRYTYRIKAINEHGTSERSRWYHIDTPEAPEPAANNPATGAPTITGTVQMGETLTANTSGIADADGLESATFTYQWLADDSEIAGATNSTYTLADTDEGIAIKVEVTFTDDAGNGETLTSAATDAVAAAEPSEPPDKPRGLEATVSHGQVVLAWNDPDDESITGYVILRRVRVNDQGGDFSVLVANTGSAATTYTDNEVASSTTYTYRIKAINEHGTSERSRWVHINTPAAPEPVANNPATGAPAITGTAQVGETLTADRSEIADEDGTENATFGYHWLADGTAISGATADAYTPVEADEGKPITVEVNFTDDAGNDETLTSAPTDAVAAAQPTEPPAKPTDLSATATHNQVVLTWKDPNDNSITGYVILRRLPGVDPEGQFDELLANTGTASTTYTDNSVSAETRYTYRIKAINQYGASERSRWFHIDTPAAPEPETDPADLAPTGLAAALTGGRVVLTWNAPAEDAGSVTGYEVLRGEGEDDPATLAADTGSAATTYTDATATTASESYAYSVKAIRDDGPSQASGEAVVQLPPAVPTGVNSAAAHDRVLLSWTDPQDASITGYRILRADVADGTQGEFVAIAEDTGSAATGYTDTTVKAEGSYVYRVQAIGPGGLSGTSVDLAVNTPPAPVTIVVAPADLQAPSNLAAELADGQVVLNWDAPAEDADTVTGYEVLRAEGQGELATLAADTGSTDTSYTDEKVAAGFSYVYRVKAIRDGERSGASNEARVQLRPAKPTGLSAETVAYNTVTLAWDEPQDDSVTGYAVVRWTLGYNSSGFVTIAEDTGTADPSYTDETVEPENEYLYHIKAINPGGESKKSEWLRAKTPEAPDPALFAPSNLTVELVDGRVSLGWDAPAEDAGSVTGYEILRARGWDDPVVLVADTGSAATAYTDETADAPGESYAYRVKAVRDGERSQASDPVVIQLPVPPPSAPAGLIASSGGGGVFLSWQAPVEDAGAVTGYEVLRARDDGELTTLVADTGNAATAYTDADAGEASERYAYRVRAIRGGERSEDSNEARVQLPPAAPKRVESAAASDLVLLSWADPVDDSVTGYRILRWREIADVASDFVTLAEDTGTAETSYADDTVENGRVYVYRVLAIGPGGLSEPSRGVRVSTTTPVAPPDRPRGLPSQGTPHPRQSVSEGGTDLPEDGTTTGRLEVGDSVMGNIDPDRDRDAFAIELVQGRFYRFDLEGSETGQGTLVNPFIRYIFGWDGSSRSVISNSTDGDSGEGKNSRLEFTLPSGTTYPTGTYYILVQEDGNDSTGTYRLSMEQVAGSGFGRTYRVEGNLQVGGTMSGTLDVPTDYGTN